MFVVSVIECVRTKQTSQIIIFLARRQSNEEVIDPAHVMNTFCIVMENSFTLPRMIKQLRDLGIGVLGTARFCKSSWPPMNLRNVSKETAKFNDFLIIDKYGTLIARWMDNRMVYYIFTIHRIESTIQRLRKRPRVTFNNKNPVSKIWGDKGATQIRITTLIDDSDHWMGGVDVSNQQISYYHAQNLRCQRNWVHIFCKLSASSATMPSLSTAHILKINHFRTKHSLLE